MCPPCTNFLSPPLRTRVKHKNIYRVFERKVNKQCTYMVYTMMNSFTWHCKITAVLFVLPLIITCVLKDTYVFINSLLYLMVLKAYIKFPYVYYMSG